MTVTTLLYVLSLEESFQSLMQLLSAKVQTTPNVNNVRSRSASTRYTLYLLSLYTLRLLQVFRRRVALATTCCLSMLPLLSLSAFSTF